MYELRVHGLGGQGAVTLVTWMARAAYETGKHVQAFPFFGAERRGAPVKAFVRIDENHIYMRSQIYNPDLLVVMSTDLVGPALQEGISPAGRLLLNCGREFAMRMSKEFSRSVYYIDATGIAIEKGLEIDGMPMVNIPLFGAMVGQAGLGSMELVMDVLHDIARRGDHDSYRSAAELGFGGVELAEGRDY